MKLIINIDNAVYSALTEAGYKFVATLRKQTHTCNISEGLVNIKRRDLDKALAKNNSDSKLQSPAEYAIEQGLTAERREQLLDEARDEYGSDDVEIDDDAEVSVAEGRGVWVQAWVWVS